jgi:hypothetical protein
MKNQAVEIIHEGKFAAEVPIALIEDDGEGGWSPYISLEDVRKLERVRKALRAGDVSTAMQWAKVFELRPVAAE